MEVVEVPGRVDSNLCNCLSSEVGIRLGRGSVGTEVDARLR